MIYVCCFIDSRTTVEAASASKRAGLRVQHGWLLVALSLVALLGAAVGQGLYLQNALRWLEQPFVGAAFTPDLSVEDVHSFSDDEWALHAAGVLPGDRVVGAVALNGQREALGDLANEWAEEDRLANLYAVLEDAELGDQLTLIVLPAEADSALPSCEAGMQDRVQSGARCVELTLQEVPPLDFALHFGLGYLAALGVLVLGGFVMWRRRESQAAQFFGLGSSALSLLISGRLDMMTRYDLLPVWVGAAIVFSAAIFSLALMFPYDLGVVRRVPNLRYAPLVVGALLLGIALWLVDARFTLTLLGLPLVALAVITLVAVMLWRRQYSSSPIVREQVSLAALGTTVGFALLLIWLGVAVLSGGQFINELTPVVQVTPILFSLSLAYAILQYRLMETDRIIPEFVVYNILGALLIGGYFLFSVGLSALAIEGLETTNPILIALTVGAVVLLFAPARTALRAAVDRAMFRQRRDYQQRREDFTRRVSDAVSLEEIFAAVVDELNETVVPKEVFLFAYDNRVGAYAPLPDPKARKVRTDITFRPDGGLAKFLVQEQPTLYLEPGQPLPIAVVRDRSQLAVLNTPLLLRLQGRKRMNGILCVGARRSGEAYTYEDLRYIESVAGQVAVAVERAQFVDDLEHRVRIQDVLSQVSNALNFAIDFDTLLELIFTQTTRIIDADHFYIVLRDSITNELYYSFYSVGDDRLYSIEGTRWQMGRDLISEVARNQNAMLVDHFRMSKPGATPQHAQHARPLRLGWAFRFPPTPQNVVCWV
ncbi:MAG: hypothetical protein HC915_05405 [Anaerolineae bacterium]|nr:hypothetical protein [Anaerolineae bacterium]